MKCLKNLAGLLAFGVWTTCGLVASAAEPETVFEIKEAKVTLADCPPTVQKTIKREVFGATINQVFEDTLDSTTTYRADVTFDDKKYDIIVAENGTLIEKVLSQDDDEDDESSKVTFAELPSAVRKTIKREAHGAKIETAAKQTHCGKTLYEVSVDIKGKNYQVKVAESGTLISKVLDEEDDEQEDNELMPTRSEDKKVSYEEKSTGETEPLTILSSDIVMLFERPELGRKVGLKVEGNFEIKETKTGILISIAPDEGDDE